MPASDSQPNPLQKIVQSLAATGAVAAIFSKFLHTLDRPLLSGSQGRFSLTQLLAGVPVILLTTRGSKSGLLRTMPVMGIPSGDQIILIATNWGQKRSPAWYHNLRANPDVTVTRDGQTCAYLARETQGDERQACWQRGVAMYAGFERYVERTGARRIPVVVLEPTCSANDF